MPSRDKSKDGTARFPLQKPAEIPTEPKKDISEDEAAQILGFDSAEKLRDDSQLKNQHLMNQEQVDEDTETMLFTPVPREEVDKAGIINMNDVIQIQVDKAIAGLKEGEIQYPTQEEVEAISITSLPPEERLREDLINFITTQLATFPTDHLLTIAKQYRKAAEDKDG